MRVEVDPMEYVEGEGKEDAAEQLLAEERKDSKLNNWVAISVAFLATFVAICTVSEHGLVKQMQHEETISLDNWNYYQARNIRASVAQAASDQFALAGAAQSGELRSAYLAKAAQYRKEADYQNAQKKDLMKAAAAADKAYETLKQRDEHYELSEAILAIAVSMLALTSLTHKRWLFWAAMAPTALGAFLGVCGLAHIRLPLESIAKVLQ